MICHHHVRSQLEMSQLDTFVNRINHEPSDLRLAKKHRPTTRIIHSAIQPHERLSGTQRTRRQGERRYAAVQTPREEQRASFFVEMRKPTALTGHLSDSGNKAPFSHEI